MSLETASFIKGLVATNPEGTDPKSQGDDHLRLIKAVLQSQFSGFTDGVPITRKESEINAMLIAGAFGLGGAALPFTDPNSVPNQTGFYYYAGGGTNLPPANAAGDTLIHIYVNATYTTQLYTRVNDGQSFVRRYNGAAWTSWSPLLIGVRQTQPRDTTAGAILPVGAFGLGVGGNAGANINIDAPLAITYVIGIVTGTTGTLPPAAAVGDMLLNVAFDGAGIMQTYYVRANARTYYRVFTSAWSVWLCMTPIGVTQVWQDVSGSRAHSTTYVNNTGRPIQVMVSIAANIAAAVVADAIVSGQAIARVTISEYAAGNYQGMTQCLSFIVPDGIGYGVTPNNLATVIKWWELR